MGNKQERIVHKFNHGKKTHGWLMGFYFKTSILQAANEARETTKKWGRELKIRTWWKDEDDVEGKKNKLELSKFKTILNIELHEDHLRE